MKKILIVLMAALLMLTAVACKANEAPKEAVKNEEPQEAAKEETVANEPLAGGWTPAENFGELTEERLAVFRKGMETLLGVDYVPLAYLGGPAGEREAAEHRRPAHRAPGGRHPGPA